MDKKKAFFSELKNILIENVVNADIENMYSEWFKSFDDVSVKKNFTFGVNNINRNQGLPDSAYLAGIDLPTWFGDYSSRKVIVLGIDPLRNKKTFRREKANIDNEVVIGTPYAFHEKESRLGGCSSYWSLVNCLSKSNFVYCTDIFKTFYLTSNGRSYNDNEFKHREIHQTILQKEIDLIKPDVIVVFGALAHKFLLDKNCPKISQPLSTTVRDLQIGSKNVKVYTVPHLSLSVRNKPMSAFMEANGAIGVNPSDRSKCGEEYAKLILNEIS